MSDPTTPTHFPRPPESPSVASEEERLLARYGADLADEDLDDEQKKELLLALWQIMLSFVDLGFRVGAGETFTEEGDFGMDDVLYSLRIIETAHETVASEDIINNTGQP